MVDTINKPEDVADLVGEGECSLLLQGDDDLSIDEAVAALTRLIPEASRLFNVERAGGGDIEASRLNDSLSSVPMMSPYRLCVIREPERLSPEAVRVLLDYLENPRRQTILVVVAGRQVKGGTSWRRIGKKMKAIKFDRPPPWELPKWVESYLKKQRLKIDRGSAAELIDSVGYDLRDLANELDKLSLFHEPGETISGEDVHLIVGRSKFADIQQLRKCLLAGDRAGTFQVADVLLYQGEEPIKLINLLSRFFAELWLVKTVRPEAGDYKSAAKMLGLWPSAVRDYWSAADRIDGDGPARAQEICYDADYRIKTGRGNPRVLLLQTVLYLSGLIGTGESISSNRPAASRS